MSALRDGESGITIEKQGAASVTNIAAGVYFDKTRVRVPFWRRLWFVVSCVPRYLITGSVEVS